MGRVLTFGVTCIVLVASCSIDDENRCLDGFVYAKMSKTCIPEDTGSADTETGSGADAGGDEDSGAAGDGGSTGLGEYCETQEECAPYEADYCAVNPLTGEGSCTYQDCDATSCPAGYTCCDCTAITGPKLCVEDGDVPDLGLYCQCM